MKALLMLLLGGVCGAVATVLLFTVDPDFDDNGADGAGGGNVTLVLSEEALAAIIAKELPSIPAFGQDPQVVATVGSNGIIDIDITIGGLGVGLRASITVNPEIVGGRLMFEVVEARLGELAVPEELADTLEGPIRQRLESLAGELDYRVTAIRTTNHQLAIDIQI